MNGYEKIKVGHAVSTLDKSGFNLIPNTVDHISGTVISTKNL